MTRCTIAFFWLALLGVSSGFRLRGLIGRSAHRFTQRMWEVDRRLGQQTVMSSQKYCSTRMKAGAEAFSQFEAQIDGTAVTGFFATTLICLAASYYWWTVIVPQKRTEIALSKRNGEIAEYLDNLREAGKEDGKRFERWLMSDWLNNKRSQKRGALPFLKKAKWNSGDNPVIVAFGGVMILCQGGLGHVCLLTCHG